MRVPFFYNGGDILFKNCYQSSDIPSGFFSLFSTCLVLMYYFYNLKNFFLLFRVTLVAYGSFQARGQIRAAAAGLCHSHSNAGFKPHLWFKMLQLVATPDLNLLREARDRTCILMDTSQVHNLLSHNGNSKKKKVYLERVDKNISFYVSLVSKFFRVNTFIVWEKNPLFFYIKTNFLPRPLVTKTVLISRCY